MPRNKWPFDRNFAEKGKGQVTIPRMEVNKKYRDMIQGEVYASTISISELEHVVLSHENLSPNSFCTDPKLSSNVPPTSPENSFCTNPIFLVTSPQPLQRTRSGVCPPRWKERSWDQSTQII